MKNYGILLSDKILLRKRALMVSVCDELKNISQTENTRHCIIATGIEDVYQGNPTTVLLADGKTMFCVWSIGHRGPNYSMEVSHDGRLTWKRMNNEINAAIFNLKWLLEGELY
jgi:hypothetical protein